MNTKIDHNLQPGDACLVVDVQADFCPGGALPVETGDEVVKPINRWIEEALTSGVPVVLTRCWHPRGHPSFEDRGGRWPPHCLQDTSGAAFHPNLTVPERAVVVSKGTRLDRDQLSAFDETGLAERLRTDGVRRLWVMGLAQDVCVLRSVLDAAELGFEVNVVVSATRALSIESGERALAEMEAAGATLVAR